MKWLFDWLVGPIFGFFRDLVADYRRDKALRDLGESIAREQAHAAEAEKREKSNAAVRNINRNSDAYKRLRDITTKPSSDDK